MSPATTTIVGEAGADVRAAIRHLLATDLDWNRGGDLGFDKGVFVRGAGRGRWVFVEIDVWTADCLANVNAPSEEDERPFAWTLCLAAAEAFVAHGANVGFHRPLREDENEDIYAITLGLTVAPKPRDWPGEWTIWGRNR